MTHTPDNTNDSVEPQLPPAIHEAGRVSDLIHAEYRGPLPAASEFAKYEQTLPGAADRILAMAELEQSNRHDLTQKQLEATNRQDEGSRHQVRRGQYFGLFVSLAAIICGAITAILSAMYGSVAGSIMGGVIGAGGLASVILAFLGDRSHADSREADTSVQSDNAQS